jgi:LuxR family maltose regulon positive regulatory protein
MNKILDTPILATKFYVPPLRQDFLPRERLLKRLNESQNYPLTLISASAGSGKTTLLSEWVAASKSPVVWISLDSDDNDPRQFLTYLFAAIGEIDKGIVENPSNSLKASAFESLDPVLAELINNVAGNRDQLTIVLDDFHTITDENTNRLVVFLVDHIPQNMHLIISTRIDPSWPLARYRVGHRLLEIRGHHLRFTESEVSRFFQHLLNKELTPTEIKAIAQRTEGWVAGLHLAALSMKNQADLADFINDFTGSHQFVAEYLVEEILDKTDPVLQNFLLKTSILERFNARLCEAVVGCADAHEVLKSLSHQNAFLIPLDDRKEYFRYHHLFADLLQVRFSQTASIDEVIDVHNKAAVWLEENDQIIDAVHHFLLGKNFQRAAQLVDEFGLKMIFSDRQNLLKSWLDALPEDIFSTLPRLEVFRLLIELIKGTLDMSESTLEDKENLINSLPPSPENDRLKRRALVHLSMFLAFQNTGKAIQIADEAQKVISDEDDLLKAYLYSVFYRAYGMIGDVDRAAEAYKESLRLSEKSGRLGMIANTTMIRTYDLCQYGRLDEASYYCERIIQAGDGKSDFYPAGPCLIGLAGVYLEKDQIELAEQHLLRGLEICQKGALQGLFTGTVQSIRLRQAKGDFSGALKEYREFEKNFQRREFTQMTRKVSVLLAAGEYDEAYALVPEIENLLGGSSFSMELPLIAVEVYKLCLARIKIVQGLFEEVSDLLDKIEVTIARDGRLGRLMEVNILRAINLYKKGGMTISEPIITSILKALEIGEQSGYVRLLVEEGQVIRPLLNEIFPRRDVSPKIKQYASRLLASLDESSGLKVERQDIPVNRLIEQLTPREQDVLVLLASGRTNQEIAADLVITIRTVKKHASNIYSKLNAANRTQAVVIAREKGLLPDL